MKLVKRKELSDSEKLEIFELWNSEYPEKLSYPNIDGLNRYLKSLLHPAHILLIDGAGKTKGWFVSFKRDEEKWFVIILDSEIQGKGLGRKLLQLAKQNESELNGWVIDHSLDTKINAETYKSPLEFYKSNGFKSLSDIRLEQDKISAVKIRWTK